MRPPGPVTRVAAGVFRAAALIGGGLRVMRLTWRQLRDEPERVLADVVRALARAGG